MIAGVLGGTFDPPHVGHLGLVRAALISTLVDEVWLAPCWSHRFGKAPAAFEHRVEMCRLLVAEEPRASVTDIERRLERPGHTLDLVLALQRDNPGVQLRLLAGADIYFQQHLWHRYDEIARIAPPLYSARRGAPELPRPFLEAPREVSSSELRQLLRRKERPVDLIPHAVLKYIESHGLYAEGGEP
ncbi:MAG: nicotinate-nicotinamide nucleotide adenylyltransferase [Myxococcota bacterium]|jgi:nicotinate-nucleotide adenylyltransferase|nr:nicotinate-nicotinamide nucleotide adenylyltransferase [Myxococcota bacterium]